MGDKSSAKKFCFIYWKAGYPMGHLEIHDTRHKASKERAKRARRGYRTSKVAPLKEPEKVPDNVTMGVIL